MRKISSAALLLLSAAFLFGNGKGDAPAADENGPFALDFMTITFSGEPAGDESEVVQYIEEYTNTDINFIWSPNTTYEDKVNITLASGDMPTIMTVPNTQKSSIINAARNGGFWEIGSYFTDYPNLSQANEITMQNSSIDGKVYGVYRARPLGRMGISFRQDWLDNLGLDVPETIDDLYEVLYAFTYNDPDQNGVDDTYGLCMSKYAGPWDIMQTYFGAPNKWGQDASGKLIPDFTTAEYREALKFFKKIYEEGLVNQDFAVLESSNWLALFIEEKGGVLVDVADHAYRLQDKMEKAGLSPVVDVIGNVSGPKGSFNLPTSGFSGMNAITTTGAETEGDMRKALAFLDQLNDKDVVNSMFYGIKGKHYSFDADGLVDQLLSPEELAPVINDLAQMGMSIVADRDQVGPNDPENRVFQLRLKSKEVYKANEADCVGNPVFSVVSETYARSGAQLDNIVKDARIKYIVGQIGDAEFDEAVDQWMSGGGEKIIAEMNAGFSR